MFRVNASLWLKVKLKPFWSHYKKTSIGSQLGGRDTGLDKKIEKESFAT